MRVFSGIQPTGKIHIGNYLGAIKQWINLQDKSESIFCIVDLHSLTVPYQPEKLSELIREKEITFLAAGIDPKKSIIFIQSKSPEHSELNWLLSTITPVGQLQRMTQYKEKSRKFSKNINAGLLNYPVLMASDILLYDTDLVPVGKDQVQHIELTRDIAQRFNKRFGETFKLPDALVPKFTEKIMSLTEPTKKMSKSDPEETRISIFEPAEKIKEKIMSAKTDSGKEIVYLPEEKPGISNLLVIYSAFSGKRIKEIENYFAGKNYGYFKEKLADLLIEKLEPFRRKKGELESREDYLDEVLEDGLKRARKIAIRKMGEIREKMGLNY